MRRTMLLLSCGLLLAASPTLAAPWDRCGLMLGAATATQSFDYAANLDFPTEYRWGVDAGVFFEPVSLSLLSVSAELHYIQKGFYQRTLITTAYQPEGNGSYWTNRTRLDYLSIPVLAKLRLPARSFSPYLLAGPRLDVLVGRAAHEPGLDSVYGELRRTDLGASFGVGVELASPALPGILAELRWSPSFTRAFNNGLLVVRNRSFEILAGVRFGK